MRLSKNITSLVGMYEVPLDSFNHVDFIWGKDAPTLVYKQLVQVIKKYADFDANVIVNLI